MLGWCATLVGCCVMSKKYLVLGCGGFVGSHFVDRLLTEPTALVEGYDLVSTKIAQHLHNPRFSFKETCIREAHVTGELQRSIRDADLVLNLAAICNPSEYNTHAINVMRQNCFHIIPIIDACAELGKWIIHFSTSEVYGRTISSYLKENDYSDPDLFEQREDETPLIMGPIQNQRWSYATSKQLVERYIFALHKEAGLTFTIIRPFNFFGPRMDYIPGRDGEGVPRVLACFMDALLHDKPLQLVDGGHAKRTITSIHDAIDALFLMLENPHAAQNQIFNVGAADNEVSIAELALMMREIFAEVTGNASVRLHPIKEVSSREFYGEGYEDSDRRIPDNTKARELLGWDAKYGLREMLELTMAYYVTEYPGRVGSEQEWKGALAS
jgi:UDP-apiose/xylose synthase